MTVSSFDIDVFFAGYAEALASRDAKRVTPFWGVPALVLSDQGVIPVAKIEEIEGFFATASQNAEYEGVATTSATVKSALPLADRIIGCEVLWEHQDAAGKPTGAEAGYYVLRRDDGGSLRIQVYVPKPQ
ncbi:MAG: hypothetical protein AB7O56_13220 [Bauldia sp.]